jgi:lipopolysaccharide biosynthesis regulator YciM
MLELLFLLLPIAVMYGWYMGVRQAKLSSDESKTSQTQQFVSGVKFLLEEKKDRASDIFVDLLHINSDNFDANLALAEVYRVRGDADKAIRIHKKLLESDIAAAQRRLVFKELAKDYVQISLYDQAIPILDELIEDPNYQVSAVKLLLNIHQSLCDWDLGIKLIDKYHSVLSEKYTVELKSQFLCERAQECIISQKVAAAYDFFIRALTINPKCVRAHICLSKLLQSQHRPLEAIPHLLEVARTDPSMIMEVIPILRICFELPREQDLYLEKLREIQENCSSSSSASLIVEMAGFMEMTNEETQNFILMHLKKNPSLRLFSELLRYQQNNAQDQQSRESLGLIQSLVNAQIVKNPVYQCKNCGFQSKILFWHCPNCSNWSTISPIRGFDGD